MQRFFKYGNPEILELLELSLVEKLMTASKKRPKPKKPKPDDPTPDNPIVDDIDKPVNQKEQDELVTEAIIFGSEEDVESLEDFVDKIEEFYNGEEQGQDELVHQVDGIFEGRDVQIKKIPKDLRTLVRTVCNDSRWGALIETKESNLKDAIGADKNKTNYFEPSNPNSIISSENRINFKLPGFDVWG